MRFPRALKDRSAVIDTMCFIYLFEDIEPHAATCAFLFEHMARGSFTGLITPITTAELVVKPLKEKRPDIADKYRHAVLGLLQTNLRLAEVHPDTGWLAGSLRAKYGLPLPDMMQAAVALEYPRSSLLTNDRQLDRVEEIDVFSLDAVCG